MHKLTQTVNSSVTAGILLGGLGLACLIWFLAYTQERVDAFNEGTTASIYMDK